jgi:hypothetical protein
MLHALLLVLVTLLAGPAHAQQTLPPLDEAPRLRDLPREARQAFTTIRVGNGLSLTGATLSLPAPIDPVPVAVSFHATPTFSITGGALVLSGQARNMALLRARGVEVDRTAFVAGSVLYGIGVAGNVTGAGILIGDELFDSAPYSSGWVQIGASTVHAAALLSLHVQSMRIRRAWGLVDLSEPTTTPDEVDGPEQRARPKATVTPSIDLVGRRIGLSVTW